MSPERDIEAGAVHLPGPPEPVHVNNVKKRVALTPRLGSTLHTTIPSSTLQVPGSSSREQTPTTNQPRQRKTIGTGPSPTSKSVGQAGTFFDNLRAELEDGVRPNCLFICWEVATSDHRAVPLLIDDTDNEVQIYRDMAGKLYERQPWWLRHNPFYQVIAIEEVEFRFLKKQDDYFSVIIKKLDISKIEEQLASRLQQATHYNAKISDFECPVNCYEDTLTANWIHQNAECPAIHTSQSCSFEVEQMITRKLDSLRLLSLPLLCFHDHAKAAEQLTLEGMAQDSCLYRTSEIKGFNGFKPRLAEAKFRGLMFRFGLQRVGVPFDAPVVGLIIVTLWKVSGGSWEVSFAAGGFFLAFISLSPKIYKF